MNFIGNMLIGAGAGYILVDVAKVVRDRIRIRRFKRELPAVWWWYHWLTMWGFVGLTEAVRTRTEPPDITVDHEALDAIGASIGSVTRKVSLTYSPDTPIWNEEELHWEESDTQLRARIKAGN